MSDPGSNVAFWRSIPLSESVAARFPDLAVHGARYLQTEPAIPTPDLGPVWSRLHDRWRGRARSEVMADQRIAPYLTFYAGIGLNPKKTPPSTLNLISRYLLGERLDRIPRIHPVVDAVNVAAAESRIPLGVFDDAQVSGSLHLDFTIGGEPFQALGGDGVEALPPGVLVLRDDQKVLSWFCYRDSEVQRVTAATRRVWLLGCQVQGISRAQVEEALALAEEGLARLSYRALDRERGR